ncbi:MAG: hypothetical protein LBH92_01000 [Bacteroidales bacterium]|jgi:hypothetical protein|nr:hypothetical protein [Bacteroidales bacterium]
MSKSSHEEVIVLIPEYEIEFDTPKKMSTWSSRLYVLPNGDTCFASIDQINRKLNFLSLSSKKIVDSIDLDFHKKQLIEDFYIISPDSILLAFMPSYLGNLHDRALVMINREKKIIDTFFLDGLPVKTKAHFDTLHNYVTDYKDFPLIHQDDVVYTSLKYDERINYCDGHASLGFIDHRNHDAYSEIPIYFPCYGDHDFYTYRFRPLRGCFDGKENLYAAFGHTPTLYKYNIATKELTQTYIPFITIDSIAPYFYTDKQSTYSIPGYDHYKGEYMNMKYDPFNEIIIWYARVAADSTDSPLCKDHTIYTFALLDKDMNKIGEGVMPEGYYRSLKPYNGGFLANNNFADGDKLILTFFNYKIEKKPSGYLASLIKERKDKYNEGYEHADIDVSLLRYANNITESKGFSKFLLVPLEMSCETCLPAYAKIIKESLPSMKKNNDLAIVLIASEQKKADDFMKIIFDDAAVDNDAKAFFYTDLTRRYLHYVDLWINPQYIEANKEIVYKKIINPGDMNLLREKLAE